MAQFVIADPQFGDKRLCATRPWKTVEEMEEAIVSLWNQVVNPEDLVYVLGDFAYKRACVKVAGRLNGRKCLVKGNHDIFDDQDYSPYFFAQCGSREVNGVLLTHYPVHPSQVEGRYRGNIHGHLHSKQLPDPIYQCVSAEHTGYKPVLLGDVISMLPE